METSAHFQRHCIISMTTATRHHLVLATDFGMFWNKKTPHIFKKSCIMKTSSAYKVFFSFSSEDMNNPVQTDSAYTLIWNSPPKTSLCSTLKYYGSTLFQHFLGGAGHTCTTSTKHWWSLETSVLSKNVLQKKKKTLNTVLHLCPSVHLCPLKWIVPKLLLGVSFLPALLAEGWPSGG